jgi:threonine aldolase
MARVDLRSDTVTRPTPAMRKAMADAEVGDAEYDDDPTVRLLQERAAEITGTEASIYLVTGTMCNQIAMHVLTRPGHVVACAQDAHVAGIEGSTSALLSGLTFRQVPTSDGVMAPGDVESSLEPDPDRGPIVDLIAVENTHQVGGGTPWALDDLHAVAEVARQAELPLYMDGSRIFNASAATGTPVSAYAAETRAVMFCLSKGLGAPIGSMLCGPADLIEEARRTKLLFGISWRQAGITAAAGVVALEEGPGRLHEDHANARLLAEGIAERTPAVIDAEPVQTNIVFADPAALGLTAQAAADRLADEGVLVNVVGHRVRFVTHRDVSAADIGVALEAWGAIADG